MIWGSSAAATITVRNDNHVEKTYRSRSTAAPDRDSGTPLRRSGQSNSGPTTAANTNMMIDAMAVEVRVRWKIESRRGTRANHAIGRAGDQRHHERDRRQHADEKPWQDFARAPRPSPSAALRPSL